MLEDFAPGWRGPSQTVNLPSLHRFVITSSEDPSMFPAFLALVSLPAHTFISLSVFSIPIPGDDLWDALSRDANVQKRTSSMASSVIILRDLADDSSLRIVFDVYCRFLSTFDAQLDWFDGLFSIVCAAPSTRTLHLSIEGSSFRDPDRLAVLFRRCPSITHLELRGIFAGDALHALGAPLDPLCPTWPRSSYTSPSRPLQDTRGTGLDRA
ncbi:uncharacterized protein BXZ73DRAFT_100577 [Epithele typhae]|uniref:uncharacterized protein n=1 Tax=Epithele typhae TaxID=378194 RepID=UPI0020071F25|nr:uncharacterized protein BXZ73DRAFT_100577 [Epithele typhae]KAH9935191.1 hypothetical protein BXZ73DRAFT_100577 [Epithele typhae]